MEKRTPVSIPGRISEMAGSYKDLQIDVPFAPGVDIKEITKNDKEPLFVTLEVLHEGVSKNNRRYSKEVIRSIAEQINEIKPDAYEGHLKEEDRATKRPKPKTLWLGATTKEVDGKLRLFAKGYILPYAKDLKQYLKAAKAASKKVAVSIYGQAKAIWNSLDNVYDLSNFVLESIDWARSGAEGVPSLGYLKLTSEMEGDGIENREDIISKLTVGEVKKFNPDLISEIKEMVKDEVSNDIDDKINEEANNAIEKGFSMIKEMVGVEKSEEIPATIKEMINEINDLRKENTENYVDKVINERVKGNAVRSLVKILVVKELNGKYNKEDIDNVISDVIKSDKVKEIISEITSSTKLVTPTIDNRKSGEGRKYTVIE